ncbi:MAG: cytochrome c [Burkholderiales bacterium]|nr:cytochrome c [Burkholderiales bacterium]
MLLLAALGALAWLNLRDEPAADDTASVASDAATVQRGAYLARAGNCAGCHTVRGGAPYAGGRGIETPFGTVFAGNLTPDADTGLGRWTAAQFWRALHNGRSADGRLLYPAFPYPHFSRITRTDSDALYAYLRSLPPVRQPSRPHALRFPYDSQFALAVWRALFFAPARHHDDPRRTADWNRGSYLVHGLGHCGACHAPRNLLGAQRRDPALDGAPVPMQDWYAPALNAAEEAGVAHWPLDEVVQWLKTGRTARATALGPMADVVVRSTQHLSDADLRAIGVYLQSQVPAPSPASITSVPVVQGRASPPGAHGTAPTGDAGRRLYERHCADCHGPQGEGVPGAYLPLAGNRTVTMANPANLVLAVVNGGFAPATTGNPRPFGMPPFGHVLTPAELADLLSYLRRAWGHQAPPVSLQQVLQ